MWASIRLGPVTVGGSSRRRGPGLTYRFLRFSMLAAYYLSVGWLITPLTGWVPGRKRR